MSLNNHFITFILSIRNKNYIIPPMPIKKIIYSYFILPYGKTPLYWFEQYIIINNIEGAAALINKYFIACDYLRQVFKIIFKYDNAYLFECLYSKSDGEYILKYIARYAIKYYCPNIFEESKIYVPIINCLNNQDIKILNTILSSAFIEMVKYKLHIPKYEILDNILRYALKRGKKKLAKYMLKNNIGNSKKYIRKYESESKFFDFINAVKNERIDEIEYSNYLGYYLDNNSEIIDNYKLFKNVKSREIIEKLYEIFVRMHFDLTYLYGIDNPILFEFIQDKISDTGKACSYDIIESCYILYSKKRCPNCYKFHTKSIY